MTQHQKFSSFTAIGATITSVLAYLINNASITGILIIAIFFGALLSGFFTIALFIATLTKKPAKTFNKLMVHFFLIWP